VKSPVNVEIAVTPIDGGSPVYFPDQPERRTPPTCWTWIMRSFRGELLNQKVNTCTYFSPHILEPTNPCLQQPRLLCDHL